MNEDVINKSQELIEKYKNLNMFDSIHVATAVVNGEKLISIDNIFNFIEEVDNVDPRVM